MRAFFDSVTRLSIRFRWITLAITLVLMALGTYAALNLNVELIPSIDFPSTYVLTQSNGGTSGDLMLQIYSIPIEEKAGDIDGVVNRESSTTTSFGFFQIRNEFGVDQEELRHNLQDRLNSVPLPTRTLRPPDGTSANDLIAELPPDVVLYLYQQSLLDDTDFLIQLSPEVWRSFSPDVLASIPDIVYEQLDDWLVEELTAKRATSSEQLQDTTISQAPALPASWQTDRFTTADDLLELTGIRSLADVFNSFVEDGFVTGPLGTVSDLTAADVDLILGYEDRCREFQNDNIGTQSLDVDTCSMFAYLDPEAVVALITRYPDMEITPERYLVGANQQDQSTIAAALTSQLLTGASVERDAPLPDEWRFEAPEMITFSISDIPLGVISVSADSTSISSDDLQHLVDNQIVPRLEDLDSVAEVSVSGGENIRPDLLNQALEAEGLESVEISSTNPTSSTVETSPETSESASSGTTTQSLPLDSGPALPATWAAFTSQIPGVTELDTADDVLNIPGLTPSQLLNSIISFTADQPEALRNTMISSLITSLTPETLFYWAEHEPLFFGNLSPEVANALALPSPVLGQSWQRLASQQEFADTALYMASDLNTLGGAKILNQIMTTTPDAFRFYAVQLANDLSPETIEYLISEDDSFLAQLDPQVYCDFSAEVLNIPEVAAYWSDKDWACQRASGDVRLAAIANGDVPTAAQEMVGSENNSRFYDPNAPLLPSNWPGIASNAGATELDTADDLFYTVENGEIRQPSSLLNAFADYPQYIRALTADILLYAADCSQHAEICEEGFYNNLSDDFLLLLSDEVAAQLPADIQARRDTARLGRYEPENAVTRTNGENSLLLRIRKEGDANTVAGWAEVEEVLNDLSAQNPNIHFDVAFEQASYIEESIGGVAREGGLGAFMAVVVILIFLNFSIRSTLVTAMSIPTSVALAFVLMKWLPGNAHSLLEPLADNSSGTVEGFLAFLMRLFPSDISLNIMTLSGLTVAIGRVVDDAIVVLENIYRNIQKGDNQLDAVLQGTRDVSVAIFAATVTTVVVFLPIGLFGGVIGAFFLPFGLAVTYALMASFVVAVTVVPLLAYLFISKSSLPQEHHSRLEHGYQAVIEWTLDHRWIVMGIAVLAFGFGIFILTQLPSAFLPSFGEPTVTIDVDLPKDINGTPTTIAVTDAKVRRLESYLLTLDGVRTVQTSVGATGGLGGSDTINEDQATITISVESQEILDRLTPQIRREAQLIFNDLDRDGTIEPNQDNVVVSGASLSEQGFGGFALVLSGNSDNPPTLADLQTYDAEIVAKLESLDGITNVESSLAQIIGGGGSVSQTYIRIDGVPAARYTAELETDDTLGVTQKAIDTVRKIDLPDNMQIDEGFESRQQTEGFRQIFVSLGIAILIVYFVMVLTFRSPVHPVTILFSLPLAIVGAALGLALTGRVLGLSSVVGLLMLVGIVVTNAIVLVDRVQTNRKAHGMETKEALVNGGTTRLRPILMTAIATMVALVPLAIGLSEGAIIAAELGTVVIGGLFSSTLLTLIVVPVVYSLFDQGLRFANERLLKRGS